MKLQKILSWATVILMAVLMALNYRILILENAFAPAGLNGIATMIQYKLNFSVGYMSLLINLPLCVLAYFMVDREYAGKSLVFTLTFSVALLLFQKADLSVFIYKTENSAILAPLTAGVINGFIYGMVLKRRGSTGGTDIVAACVHEKRPEISLVWLIFTINCAVAVASYFVYGYQLEPVILCILYSFLTGKVSDLFLQGGKSQWRVEIITDNPEELAREVMEKLRHGVTAIPGKGMYSGQDKSVLVCVISKHQIPKLEGIIANYPASFAAVVPIHDVYGNFKHVKP